MSLIDLLIEVSIADAIALKVLLGAIFGLFLGLTGVGGGVLLIPLLQVFCEMHTVLAVGTASIISALVKINASYSHIRAQNVSWQAVTYLFLGAVPLTFIATQVVIYFSNHPMHEQTTQNIVSGLVICVMVGALTSIIIKLRQCNIRSETHSPASKTTTLISGMVCGSVLGSTGVGGGILLLPVLNTILKVDIKRAIGSSVVLALFLSSIAALSYARGGQADFVTAILFVAGSFFGVPVATRLLGRLSENVIYFITMSVICCSLALTIFV
ncbi:sulfite exporter TauE/SafE family protein [Vibrio sp. E150_011]